MIGLQEPESRPDPRRPRLPPVSSSFDKARRSYGVATALLLGWALVGIELSDKPLSSVDVTLKSPHAAPFIMLASVIYFAFRFTIEWYLSEPERRAHSAARIDFGFAHLLGVVAVVIFVGQQLTKVQLADKFTTAWAITVISGCLFGQGLWFIVQSRNPAIVVLPWFVRGYGLVECLTSGLVGAFVTFRADARVLHIAVFLASAVASWVACRYCIRSNKLRQSWGFRPLA